MENNKLSGKKKKDLHYNENIENIFKQYKIFHYREFLMLLSAICAHVDITFGNNVGFYH